jgi:hypothetical protein
MDNERRIYALCKARWADGLLCDEAEIELDIPHQTCSARFLQMRKSGRLYRLPKIRNGIVYFESGLVEQRWTQYDKLADVYVVDEYYQGLRDGTIVAKAPRQRPVRSKVQYPVEKYDRDSIRRAAKVPLLWGGGEHSLGRSISQHILTLIGEQDSDSDFVILGRDDVERLIDQGGYVRMGMRLQPRPRLLRMLWHWFEGLEIFRGED